MCSSDLGKLSQYKARLVAQGFSQIPGQDFEATFSPIMHMDSLWTLLAIVSQLATGCVTCHTSHGCVTHFRPILGNLVEVTLVTFPFMYIVSHAKGTSFP